MLYNDECEFRVYDGRSGSVLFKNVSNSRTGIENPVVASKRRTAVRFGGTNSAANSVRPSGSFTSLAASVFERNLGCETQEGIELRVVLFDPLDERAYILDGRNLSLSQQPGGVLQASVRFLRTQAPGTQSQVHPFQAGQVCKGDRDDLSLDIADELGQR